MVSSAPKIVEQGKQCYMDTKEGKNAIWTPEGHDWDIVRIDQDTIRIPLKKSHFKKGLALGTPNMTPTVDAALR